MKTQSTLPRHLTTLCAALATLLSAGALHGAPELFVRVSAHPPTSLTEQTASTGPLTLESRSGLNVTGGFAHSKATAGFGFLHVASRATTEDGPPQESAFGAGGRAQFKDTVTIDAPGRTGTAGRVTFLYRTSGRISATGEAGGRADIGSSYTIGYVAESNGRRENYNFLGEQTRFQQEFTFGVPFTLEVQINGGSSADTWSARASIAEIALSWQGIEQVTAAGDSQPLADFTIAAESGANYAQPITSFATGAAPAQADLVVSTADSPNPVADGGTITYRTTVRNAGPNTAEGVQGSIIFRDGIFMSTTLPQGSYTRLGTGLNINLPDLASATETTFDMVFRVDQPPPGKPQRTTFDASFFSNAIDPNRANNSSKVETGFSTPAPPIPAYYLEQLLPPSDYSPTTGHFEARAINAQGYVAITFDADNDDPNARRNPLIYKGTGQPYVALSWPGALNPRAAEQPYINSISDTAPDGSYWVCGFYINDVGHFRPVAWHVTADGGSTIYALRNRSGLNGVELSAGSATAINSSGEAIGHSDGGAQYWRSPNQPGEEFRSGSVAIGVEKDIQEDGYAVGEGDGYDAYLIDVRGLRNPGRLPTIPGRGPLTQAIDTDRVVGSYGFKDDDGPNGPFVYNLGDSGPTRLPKPSGLVGDIYVDSSGDSGTDINAKGDILGTASNPPTLGNDHNRGFGVLWQRRADGSYRVRTLQSLWQQTVSFGFTYPSYGPLGIADDGTILLNAFYNNVPGVFLLRAGDDPRPKVTSPLKATGTTGQPFSYQITATNNPTQFHAEFLPPGLQLNANTGLISGTGPGAGEYVARIWATNGQGFGIVEFFAQLTFIDPADVPVVTITSPSNGATFTAGTAVTFSASATSNNGIERIVFTDNGVQVARHSGGEGQSILGGLTPGQHILTATAVNNLGQVGSSSVTILVNAANSINFTFFGNGDWFDAANWSPQGVPGANDTVVIGQKSLTISQPVTVRGLTLNGTTLSGSGDISVTESFTFAAGSLNNLTVNLEPGAIWALLGDGAKTFENVAINNYGTTILSGSGPIEGDAATVFSNFGVLTFSGQEEQPTHATFGELLNLRTVELKGASLKILGEFVQQAGETNLGCAEQFQFAQSILGQIEALQVTLEGGSLLGTGRIFGSLLTRATQVIQNIFIMPGCSPGIIEVSGNYVQSQNTTLVLEVAGRDASAPQYDQLKIGGQATLDGNLIVRTTEDFTPTGNDSFAPITYASAIGDFANVTSNAQVTLGSSGASMQVSGANPPAPKALNIATRMKVETGDNVLIAGFIITGSQPKKVIIRGIGPSLPFGGVLANPTLNLDNGAVTNDDWRNNQEQEIIATTIPPSHNLESAIVATLAPGPHTAILAGAGGATGIGVVEVYDLDSGSPVQLANISSRGFVQSGDNVMIGGFIIGGTYPTKVVIRAIGPSLPIPGVLQNPTLELVDSNGNRISNDNWRTTQEAELIATTVPPTHDQEAAIVATLVPGAYTAIVRGKDDTTGIAVVEAYNLQ